MSFGYGKNRKSPLIARFQSYLLPGLGHIYSGNTITGIVWISLSVPFVGLIFYLVYSWVIGLMSSFVVRAIIILIIFYFMFAWFCANEAVAYTIQRNMRTALEEEVQHEKRI